MDGVYIGGGGGSWGGAASHAGKGLNLGGDLGYEGKGKTPKTSHFTESTIGCGGERREGEKGARIQFVDEMEGEAS